ncbi:hypothetical protein A2631_01605 [Candidatus Daviesbacteria bacterium RIFCSPHIGHO2_01_FULL_44_29]|uniref:Uncharacterized protein n=1 Tax=Candidatus Daviesbacteria bacterium RIFCSPHIGHO2_02_FULL_43_12 TaxID=1797776 RepID=A0A1F5KJW6_9BACT|nr:MAG: hypothetical protein A2631_01605 [Candidatus Daviesbacteria bacterium RIFCSPHIGHO2_01_FULL_44_29]OGE39055.1 MAG: hypothetical protein A3E86_00475 [Candidatus Daviesbacteria bacterium RIFCSPHIGHO2_12_FULL_47_45]OGE41100.1 MAG: hypothetical protein A3D25_01000 [Candidatus Daviesbacteria bacterium RIFCSPHIGHO2_02_FULL_43_12]OGE69299.1 MAG: hypothetical protein A3B55_02740 [Candidatus Daviesbacteria bacterium RIFCSPLOWO2_01_FULL_43_15]
MDEKTKEDFIKLFNQGFEEMVLPQFEEIREDMASMRKEMATQTDINRLERKIDHLLDKSGDHENRLKRIETLPIIASELRAVK